MNTKTIYFKTYEERMDKLKEWRLISQRSKRIKEYIYKDYKGDKEVCSIIGYMIKETLPECINRKYETLIINTKDKRININIDYFKDMQID